MVLSWEDDFLEIFYKISVSIPSFARIFVECKHRKAGDRRKVNFIRRLSCKFRIPSRALSRTLHPEASRDSWYTPLTLLILSLREEVVHVDSNHVVCANSAPPDHPPYIENGQPKRQQRKRINVQCSRQRAEWDIKKLFLYVQVYQLFKLCTDDLGTSKQSIRKDLNNFIISTVWMV